MTFEKDFPSLDEYESMYIDTYYDAYGDRFDSITGQERVFTKPIIKKTCLDKHKVREAIFKFTSGTKYVRHEDCDRPFGDDCGYCEFCKQRQHELQNKIFEELGLEDKDE